MPFLKIANNNNSRREKKEVKRKINTDKNRDEEKNQQLKYDIAVLPSFGHCALQSHQASAQEVPP